CVSSPETCGAGIRSDEAPCSINRTSRRNRPELLDTVAAADIPVVEVDGPVAVAGDQADLVAEPEPVGGGGGGEAAVLVGGALVADERRAGIKGQCLESASTIARSSAGRLIAVAQTRSLGSKALVGAPSWSRLRP